MGSLGEKKWVIYIYCIDFPKSALAANQLLSSYTFLRRVATYRQKKSKLFCTLAFISFWIQHFYPIGEKIFQWCKKSF